MKKLLILLTALLLPMVASADAVEIDGIYYNLVAKIKQAEVTSNTNHYSGEVIIPESIIYDGANYIVTSIGDYAFRDCSGLTSITIPNCVTSIGYAAFYGCSSLTSITIPNSVTSIGDYAFGTCHGLTSVHISDLEAWCKIFFGDEISNPLFYAHHLYMNGNEITNLVIPNSVTSIGDYAFEYCSGLTSVTIPNSVTSIGFYAFQDCSGLTSVHISDLEAWCKIFFGNSSSNPLYYSHHLYMNSSEITNLVIPNSVTSIGNYAFYGCISLSSVTIPNSVTSIGNYAFYGCSGLTTITIGSGVKRISDRAFAYCPELTVVTCLAENVPNTSSSYDYDAFDGSLIEYATLHVPAASIDLYKAAEPWKDFKEIVAISEQQPTEENIIFADANVKSICVANWDTNDDGELSKTEAAAVTDIGTVFKENTNITSFDELQYFIGLTSIDWRAFRDCTALSTIIIPASVSVINNGAFRGCTNMSTIYVDVNNNNYKSINGVLFTKDGKQLLLFPSKQEGAYAIPDGTEKIDDYAFQYAKITELTFPSSLKTIGYSTFERCNNLKNIVIPSTISSLGEQAFYGCSNLESAVLPDNITEIPAFLFAFCSKLKSVTLSPNTISIANGFVRNCYALTEIEIPATVTSIGKWAFCESGLKNVKSLMENPCAVDETTFGDITANSTLYVPAGSKALYEAANYWKDFMEIVAISEQQPTEDNIIFSDANVKAICVSNWDTNGDGELSKTEAAAVTDIGTVFKENTNITSFDELQYFIGLTSIDWRAFRDCTALSTIIIPASVSVINNGAFRGCTNMSTIYVDVNNNNYKSINGVLFTKDGKQLLLFPSKQEGAYAIPDGTEKIDDYAFQYAKITELTFPSSLKTIGYSTFERCNNLKNIVIPSTISSLGEQAFYGCSNLESAVLPDNITEIPAFLFAFCSKLKSVTLSPNTISIANGFVRNCYALTEIEIPATVTSIGKWAFCESGLKNVKSLMENPCAVDETTFGDITANSTLYVPAGSKALYEAANYWKDFIEIVENVEISDAFCLYVTDKYALPGTKVLLPIELSNKEEVKLCQFDLQLPAGVTVATKSNGKLDAKLTERAETHSISSQQLSNGNYRFIISSMDNDSFTGNSGTLVEITLDIPATMEAGEYTIKLLNAELSVPNGTDLDVVKPADTESKLTVKAYTPGDVNNDGSVSVTDVGCAINYILEQVPSVFIFEAADMNGDKSVSVTDVGMIINLILNEGVAASPQLNRAAAGDAHLTQQSTTDGYQLQLGNKDAFIGFQIDLQVANNAAINDMKLIGGDDHLMTYRQLENGSYRVVCYSPTNSTFEANDAGLLNISTTGDVTISNVRLTTADFSEVRLDAVSGGTTGITDVKELQGDELKVYSLDGRLCRTISVQQGENTLNGLKPGVYMIGNRKVVVR